MKAGGFSTFCRPLKWIPIICIVFASNRLQSDLKRKFAFSILSNLKNLILFNKFTLKNGLRVIHHEDKNSQLCALNVLYDVGAKDELSTKTGFAHLFEHLMFGGSVNIPDFDGQLQQVGGEDNAFTNNDFTNYYLTLPASNIETGFWLESDRMLSLTFSQESLDVQRSVVMEEFKERYLNQPYGDAWLHLLPLAYIVHPYQWPTIGKELSHIEDALLTDVEDFFGKYYSPNNAILVIAGNISLQKAEELARKWFSDIPNRERPVRDLPREPKQELHRSKTLRGNVPLNSLTKAYHMCGRMDPDYYAFDLLSDILGTGKSSHLYNDLVKSRKLFVEIDSYLSGDIDPGLLIIEGKLSKGVPMEVAERAIEEVCAKIKEKVTAAELQKVKNKTETNIRFNDVGVLNKAMKLAYCELLGDVDLVNNEAACYAAVTADHISRLANECLQPQNCSTLYYLSEADTHAES